MATKKFIIVAGQSNAGPVADYVDWVTARAELNFGFTTQVTKGSYTDKFTMPGSIPGVSSIDVKGVALSTIRYLTFWHPHSTGYSTYPHQMRVVDDTGGSSANTASAFYSNVLFDATAVTQSVTITRTRTGETRTISAVSTAATLPSGATCRITVSSAFSATPDDGEQFTYDIKASALVAAGTTIQLTNKFSNATWTGTLVGLELTVGATTRTITGWADATRTATLSGTVSASAGDAITISPQGATEFHKYAFWLPWCPFEAASSQAAFGKTNPFPHGFNYPNHYHIPFDFRPEDVSGTTVATTGGIPELVAWHVGLAVRLREYFGETIYLLPSDFSGTTLAQSEFPSGTVAIGWCDRALQNYWAPGEDNNCFGRIADELSAAATAFTAEGNTGECVGIVFMHGESDGLNEQMAGRYAENLRRLKTKLRQAVKDAGLCSGDATKIPWVQPQVPVGNFGDYADDINEAINEVVAEDRYMRTFDVSDATFNDDGIHYDAAFATKVEARSCEALIEIYRETNSGGEVSICNLALSYIGETAKVTSIDPADGSAQATHCARFYPIARDTLLSMRPWSFALKRKALAEATNTLTTWTYAYTLPPDAINVIAVLSPDATDDYVQPGEVDMGQGLNASVPSFAMNSPQQFTIEVDGRGRRILYTNQEDAVLRYSARVTDATLFPNAFVEALAWKLASMLAGPIIKGEAGAAEAKRCIQMMAFHLGNADTVDARQRQVTPIHSAPWHRAR